jgi:hypothetical protein
MAKKLDAKETVTFEELLMSNMYTQEALINLLVKKGLIKKQELLEEIRKLTKCLKLLIAWTMFEPFGQ